jgi:hypothetical protein
MKCLWQQGLWTQRRLLTPQLQLYSMYNYSRTYQAHTDWLPHPHFRSMYGVRIRFIPSPATRSHIPPHPPVFSSPRAAHTRQILCGMYTSNYTNTPEETTSLLLSSPCFPASAMRNTLSSGFFTGFVVCLSFSPGDGSRQESQGLLEIFDFLMFFFFSRFFMVVGL